MEAAGARIWSRLAAELDKRDTSLRSLYGDGWSAPPLKPREFQVLSAAAWLLNEGAAATLDDIHGVIGTDVVSRLCVLITLKQLKWRRLVRVDRQTRKRYRITVDGDRALARARAEGKVWAQGLVHKLRDV